MRLLFMLSNDQTSVIIDSIIRLLQSVTSDMGNNSEITLVELYMNIYIYNVNVFEWQYTHLNHRSTTHTCNVCE